MTRASSQTNRRTFIGGSDARIIMGDDETALLRLWREKRGEAEPEDLTGNLVVQLGLATEDLNRLWYERNTGQTVECVHHRLRHPVLRWMGATLDGMVAGSGAVFEAKFMLPWSFSEEAAAEKHMAQVMPRRLGHEHGIGDHEWKGDWRPACGFDDSSMAPKDSKFLGLPEAEPRPDPPDRDSEGKGEIQSIREIYPGRSIRSRKHHDWRRRRIACAAADRGGLTAFEQEKLSTP